MALQGSAPLRVIGARGSASMDSALGTCIETAMPQDHDGQPVGSVDVTIPDMSGTPAALDRTRRSINVPMLGCSRFAAQSVKGY